jgi:uncharacterized protein DUF4055
MSIWGQLQSWVVQAGLTGGDKDAPDAMSPTVQGWQQNLSLVRTIYGGWQSLYKQRSYFLPQHPKEDPQDYLIRARRPTFYNAFGRTVRALAGAPFSQPPTPEGVPAEILTLYKDDIDNEGTAGDAFVRHTFQDALITGLAGIFVDMPVLEQAEGGPELNRGDELAAGLRPFWSLVAMDDIVSFRPVVENGKVLLAYLSYVTRVAVPFGKYGVKIVEELRIYRRLPAIAGATDKATILYESWRRDAGKQKWVIADTGELPTVTEIPLAQIYTERVDFMDANPPLLDLANVNLLHYQMWSDLAHAAHVANVPIIVTQGFPGELQLGPNLSINFPEGSKDAKAYWMETTGASLGSTRALLADLEEQMAHLGLGMLQRKSRAAETAAKASLDRKDQESTLAAAVSDLENGLEQALFWTAQYMGLESGGRFSFTRAFEMDPTAAAPTENQGAPKNPNEPKAPGQTNNPATSTGAN